MAATLKDVAKRAGVSVITVSRVVNQGNNVHSATRAKVLAVIEELQYVPNQMASNLRSRHNDTLALIVPNIATTFWTGMARGAEDEAWANGYGIFLCNTDDDPAKEERYVDILLRRRVEGIAIVPTLGSANLLRRLQQRQQRFVVLHRKIAGIEADVVRSDSRGGAFALTKRLLAAGWRRIAYIGGPLGGSLGQDRLAGFTEALATVGVTPDPALVKIGVHTQRSGYDLVIQLLHAGPPPEALLIGNSRLALGALHALAETGVRVPDDLAVATFFEHSTLIDDSRLARTPLTIATQPAYDIGRLGIRRLLTRITGDQREVEDLTLPNLITDHPAEAADLTNSAHSAIHHTTAVGADEGTPQYRARA